MAATPVTLKPMFDADPAMAELGGPGYLATLTQNGVAVLAARDFASQIYDLALLRELIRVGREMVTEASDTSRDIAPITRSVAELTRLTTRPAVEPLAGGGGGGTVGGTAGGTVVGGGTTPFWYV